MIDSIHFLTIERDKRSLVTMAQNKYFKELRCIQSHRDTNACIAHYWWGAGHWGIAADLAEDELQIHTCRTCRTDVHNVAVGHKNAIKSLFGFGVACKIDSSGGGGEEKKKREAKQCNTHNIKLYTLLFFPPIPWKTRLSIQTGLDVTTSIYKDTGSGVLLPPYTTVPLSDSTPTG